MKTIHHLTARHLDFIMQSVDEQPVTAAALHQPVMPISVIPNMCYRESILAFFEWNPADDLRG